MLSFTDQEKAILHIVQSNIPESLTPYADIAARVGVSEEDVITLLARLKANGGIRRYGAMIRHQKTDWVHNAMVAWKVEESLVEQCGEIAASVENISHVYYRPSKNPDWPYTLYTMIHGRTPDEWRSTITRLQSISPLSEHVVLRTLKELKKVSMRYF
ncbi:MAG: Lrp/AsnC family transcriptional regulator [Desulfovibrio sp.]|nr:Lrp/AsnC family transcriptional regulator [Desulfovibrio sp.]